MSDKIIIEGGTGEIVEKKSRFIATVKAVFSEEEAIAFVAGMKKKYWDARHNCMAYIINEVKRFSDDGEPSGTAGKPILDVLETNKLTNVVIVVTRYFGGILLGTGGLVRAYQKAAIEGIKNSVTAEKQEGICVSVKTDYTGLGKIQYIAAASQIDIVDIEYLEHVVLKIVCETKKFDSFISKVTEATAGKAAVGEKESVVFCKMETGIQIVSS